MPSASELFATIDLKGCSKVFILLLLLSIVLFIIYLLIKPDKSKQINVLPFPSSGPFVPMDSSKCGRDVINCTANTSACVQDGGCDSANYACTPVRTDQEVWYLGTKLEAGQLYCLPKQNINVYNTCGTYTGKALWSQTAQGDGSVAGAWICECKYPSLFNGYECQTPVACSRDNGTHGILTKTDGSGTTWNPISPSKLNAIAEKDNPLDWSADGTKPLYQCDCSVGDTTGSYMETDDPYRCHSNICYGGISATQISSMANFDPITDQCVCDNVSMVKSNVTGFCYPIEQESVDTHCLPDILTGNCTCGNKFVQANNLGIPFRKGQDLYITYQIPGDPKCQQKVASPNCPIYRILINDSTATITTGGITQKITDLLKTTLTDITGTIIEFTLMQYTLLPMEINSTVFQPYIISSVSTNFTTAFSAINAMNAVVEQGVDSSGRPNPLIAIPCDSYFYNRPGAIKCSDSFYHASDDNNKSGVMCYNPTAGQACGGHGTPKVDVFDSQGYLCVCNDENCISLLNNHTCGHCPKCPGDSCVNDSDCMNCSHCNPGWGGLSCGGGY